MPGIRKYKFHHLYLLLITFISLMKICQFKIVIIASREICVCVTFGFLKYCSRKVDLRIVRGYGGFGNVEGRLDSVIAKKYLRGDSS